MPVWNKGLTKETHPSLKKTSVTMRTRRLDNFKSWRDEMKQAGIIKSQYPPFKKNGDLAELIGIVLGDGHIGTHERCESLRIVGDANKMGFVNRAANLIESVFGKRPNIAKRKNGNGVNITLYEKGIAKRLGIPTGGRSYYRFVLPRWIARNRKYTLRFLRGLYEAEGSLSHHAATYTHKFTFSNTNPHLLALVAGLVRKLGFTVSVSKLQAQVSRKDEVQKLANLVHFRDYDS